MRGSALALRTVAAAAVLAFGAGCGSSGPAATPPADERPPAKVLADAPGGRECPKPAEWVPGPAPTTIEETPANTPEATALANAIAKVAEGSSAGAEHGPFGDAFGAVINDHPAGRVALCVTDLARGRELLAAAKKADPAVDPARADLYTSRYTLRALMAAGDRLPRDPKAFSFPLHTWGPAADASGLSVTSTAAGAASAAFRAELSAAVGGIPVTLGVRPVPVLG
ncbi:hypothetical protein ACM614_20115 [Streptomyces sp. 12297]|uniref:hypothetical protein n=1 Tax=Streptomyces sp. NBC_00239 TaxID=2903640 RepID=UPI002E2D2D85|nr:hypothetical protein [Streptomyces sp. NBC_00239]